MAIELTLISRHYCHLCHDMEMALLPLVEEFGAVLNIIDVDLDPIIDVDLDPMLEARFDELVPVLLHRDNAICHHFLDERKTREYLAEIR